MLSNAEKPDFKNARAIRVCQKVISVSVRMFEKPYIYGIMRKTGMEWIILDLAVVNLVEFRPRTHKNILI